MGKQLQNSMNKLAIFGGPKVRSKPFPFPPFPILGKEEERAAITAIRKGVLSSFIGAPGEAFGAGSMLKSLRRSLLSITVLSMPFPLIPRLRRFTARSLPPA